jgi:hypothetical protein
MTELANGSRPAATPSYYSGLAKIAGFIKPNAATPSGFSGLYTPLIAL